MRRKVLQHTANSLCQMFCGWQLFADWGVLTRLGGGSLRIDALRGRCEHDGRPIAPLTMAEYLHSWLEEDCARNRIPTASLHTAALEVTFATREADEQRDSSVHFSDPRPPFVLCDLSCRALVETDEAAYHATREAKVDWPKCMAK